MLFALSVDEVARIVQSELNVWYLDDASKNLVGRTASGGQITGYWFTG